MREILTGVLHDKGLFTLKAKEWVVLANYIMKNLKVDVQKLPLQD